ncbi:hypothetical protein ACIPPS_22795 [Streptomyces sp. NPDC090127]|uniref:hypothetical protein n=1 Tax=Streptomyces sp. NPDC090127 TaxID=3365953 RepID=UPI00380A6D20
MSMEKAGPRPEPEGCLTAAVRIPVRIVVLLVVVPVRMVWDVLVVAARALDRTVLRPTGRALAWLARALFVRPWVWLWREALVPAVHHGLVAPTVWLYTRLLTPLGRGLVVGGRWVAMALLVWPWVGLWRYVVVPVARYGIGVPAVWAYRWILTPLGRGLVVGGRWVAMALLVWPWVGLWRYVVVPVARYGIGVPAVWAYRWILTPLATGLAFVVRGLWRHVLVPAARYGIAVSASWLYRHVLTPVGHGLAWLLIGLGRGLGWVLAGVGRGLVVGFGALGRGLGWVLAGVGRGLVVGFGALGRGLGWAFTWLGRGLRWAGAALFVWPWVALWRYVLVPLVRYGIVVPLGWLWQRVLAPLGRELLDALTICWRVAGFLSRAVGRALARIAWNLVGRPTTWVYRSLCTPLGHWVRDQVWTPARTAVAAARRAARETLAAARATVRQARRDAWRALVGGPRVTEPGEPVVASTRTLGSTTTVSGAAPTPEISLRKRG